MLIICNESGRPTGEYLPKALCHQGEGRRHLAITLLLFNREGQVLLQRRKHGLFDDVWDLTAATHLLHHCDGSDESIDDAAARCLWREYQIEPVHVAVLGAFSYFARYGERCENEYCFTLVGELNGSFKLNPEVAYGSQWVDQADFYADIARSPEKYSPWAVLAVPIIRAPSVRVEGVIAVVEPL